MENKVFKNWPAICAVQDKFVKWAIACLNLNSELGQRIAKQLPEYFTDPRSARADSAFGDEAEGTGICQDQWRRP